MDLVDDHLDLMAHFEPMSAKCCFGEEKCDGKQTQIDSSICMVTNVTSMCKCSIGIMWFNATRV